MKCAACGYDEALPFIRLQDAFKKKDIDYYYFLYACPSCGTLKLEYDHKNLNQHPKSKFDGCQCPFCKCSHEGNFNTRRALGNGLYSYRVACERCGAEGPLRAKEENAIEDFRDWMGKNNVSQT